MEIQGFVPVTKTPQEKRNMSVGGTQMSKSRDKNFRIMKKTILEKKEEPSFGAKNLGLIMVTGLCQQSNFPSSLDQQMTAPNLPPKFKSNLRGGSYR